MSLIKALKDIIELRLKIWLWKSQKELSAQEYKRFEPLLELKVNDAYKQGFQRGRNFEKNKDKIIKDSYANTKRKN